MTPHTGHIHTHSPIAHDENFITHCCPTKQFLLDGATLVIFQWLVDHFIFLWAIQLVDAKSSFQPKIDSSILCFVFWKEDLSPVWAWLRGHSDTTKCSGWPFVTTPGHVLDSRSSPLVWLHNWRCIWPFKWPSKLSNAIIIQFKPRLCKNWILCSSTHSWCPCEVER